MPRRPLTTAQVRQRFLVCSCVLAIIVATTTIWSMSVGYSTKTYHHSWGGGYRAQAVEPTPAQQAATLVATQSFRRQIVMAAQAFAAHTAALARDTAAGNVVAAQSDELAAQSDYDVLRPVIPVTVAGSEPLDALVADQNPALGAQGLHAIERALWSGHIASAVAPARTLAQEGAVLPYFLLRTILTPAAICSALGESLSWTVENVIDTPHELFSHRDLVDVKSVTDAAAVTVGALTRIGVLVEPSATTALVRRMGALTRTVGSVNPSSTDQMVPAATWLRIAQEMDAVVAASGTLGGYLTGFGSGRPYA